MHIDANKEEGSPVGMYISNKSSVVYVSADVGDGGESYGDVRCVVYG